MNVNQHVIPRVQYGIILLIPLLLSACVKAPEVKTTETELSPIPEYVRPQTNGTELTSDVLYELMIAEMAGQKGQLNSALQRYQDLSQVIDDPQLAERAARIAVFARNNEKALESATRWAYLDPENSDAHQLLSVLYIRQGRIDDAVRELRTILRQPGNKAQRLRNIVNLLGREEDSKAALAVMQRLMIGHEKDSEVLFAYALFALRAGAEVEARKIMQQAMAISPGNSRMALAYLGIMQKQGDITGAIEWLQALLVKSPDNSEMRLIYARLLADNKRFAESREQFGILVKAVPENIDVHYALGLLNLQTQRPEQAQKSFEQLLTLQGHVNESRFYLGQIAEMQGDYPKAITWLGLVSDNPLVFDAQIQIVDLLARQKKYDESQTQLELIQANDDKQQLLLLRAKAEILIAQEKLQEAMAQYDYALEQDLNVDVLYSRAMLAEKMGRLDILEDDLRTIIGQQPGNSQALNALGYTLANRTDRYEDAYELIKRALELSPEDFYILDSMGWVLYRMGRFTESVKFLKQAIKIRPDAEIAAHLGEVLWVMGEQNEANTVWESALKLTPEDQLLNDVINRLKKP